MNPYAAPQTEPIDTGEKWKDAAAWAFVCIILLYCWPAAVFRYLAERCIERGRHNSYDVLWVVGLVLGFVWMVSLGVLIVFLGRHFFP